MQLLYILVLLTSAVMVTAGLLRVQHQLAPVFGKDRYVIGAVVSLPMLAFLTIVATPAPVVLAALLLALLGMWDEYRGISRELGLVLTLAAASIALMGLPTPSVTAIPAPLLLLTLWLCWWGLILLAEKLPRTPGTCTSLTALALLPLLIGIVIGDVPRHLALDCAMVGGVLLGMLLGLRKEGRLAVSFALPLLLFIGYAMARALITGAWPFALTSAAILIIGLFLPRARAAQPGVVEAH